MTRHPGTLKKDTK